MLINHVYNVKCSTFPWLIKYFLNKLSAHPISVVMTFELGLSWLLGFSEFYADSKYRKRTFFIVFEERHSHSPATFPQSWPSKLSAETLAHISLYTSRSMKWVPSTGKEHCDHTSVPCSLVCSHPVPRPLVSFPAKKELLGSTPSITQGQNPKPITCTVFYFDLFILLNVWMLWLHVCMCMPGVWRGQKRALDT